MSDDSDLLGSPWHLGSLGPRPASSSDGPPEPQGISAAEARERPALFSGVVAAVLLGLCTGAPRLRDHGAVVRMALLCRASALTNKSRCDTHRSARNRRLDAGRGSAARGCGAEWRKIDAAVLERDGHAAGSAASLPPRSIIRALAWLAASRPTTTWSPRAATTTGAAAASDGRHP